MGKFIISPEKYRQMEMYVNLYELSSLIANRMYPLILNPHRNVWFTVEHTMPTVLKIIRGSKNFRGYREEFTKLTQQQMQKFYSIPECRENFPNTHNDVWLKW